MLGEDGARAVLAAVQWRRRQMAVGPSGCPEPGSQRATHGDDWRVFLGCGSTVGFGMVQAKVGLGAGTAEPMARIVRWAARGWSFPSWAPAAPGPAAMASQRQGRRAVVTGGIRTREPLTSACAAAGPAARAVGPAMGRKARGNGGSTAGGNWGRRYPPRNHRAKCTALPG